MCAEPKHWNGTTRKVLKGNDGAVPIDIPRDRDGSFEPELIRKGQTRIDGMDDKIIGLYAAGLSTRDIRAHLEEVYGVKVTDGSLASPGSFCTCGCCRVCSDVSFWTG
jgi:transposase-like protein